MQKRTIKTSLGTCSVCVGDGAFSAFAEGEKGKRKPFVVTDKTVFSLYGKLLRVAFPTADFFLLPSIRNTEKNKSGKALFKILQRMSELGVKRDGVLYAVGGGTVGDVGALAAALYMRGIAYVQIPTTLLAQVDSALGGKSAINLGKIKNTVGSFYPPESVIVDPLFLKTLPPREIKCGLGEIVKYAVLSPEIYDKLDDGEEGSLSSLAFLTSVTEDCLFFKSDVVERDERDTGDRKCLNLGHTTAHALELSYRLSHGEGVMLGLLCETEFAVRKGWCKREDAEKIAELVYAAWSVAPLSKLRFSNEKKLKKALMNAAADKKNEGDGEVCLCAPRSVGEWALYKTDVETYVGTMSEILQGLIKK